MRTAVLAATAWAALAGSAGADELHESDANGRFGAHVLVRVGQASAPFYTPALSETEAEFTQARMVIIGGHLAVSARLSLGARLPLALSTIRLPGGSYFDGSLLLGVEPRIVLVFSSVTLTADLVLPLAGPLDGTIAAGFTVALER